jgi:hypothetical protein
MTVHAAVVALFFAVIAQTATPDTAQVTLQDGAVALDGRLTFSARGFDAGEPTSVTVEDGQRTVQTTLQPVRVEADGQVYMVSVPIPAGLAPGAHTLRVTGLASGRFGHADFNLVWQTPSVHLDAYTGKPSHTVSFDGSGFVPGESVDLYLGQKSQDPLASVTADGKGDITGQDVAIPFLDAGDYRVSFVGRTSQMPVSVGFNVQGFRPWVVLHSYYLAPLSSIGFTGHDFIPGEAVDIYLNSRMSTPLMQVTADRDGAFSVDNASLPTLAGDNALIFVGHQSQTELTADFSIAKE